MVEVKADALEASFDAILQGERIAALEARMDGVIKARNVEVVRPPLDGVKGAAVDPARMASSIPHQGRRGDLRWRFGADAGRLCCVGRRRG
ncbi:MAG: hypothetical protein ABW169_06585, partial [Sphingobium sp.]